MIPVKNDTLQIIYCAVSYNAVVCSSVNNRPGRVLGESSPTKLGQYQKFKLEKKMKKMSLLVLSMITISTSSYAASYSGIACNSQKGFTCKYGSEGSENPAADATIKLNSSITSIPNAGTAGHSTFFGTYVEVSKKSLSELQIATQNIPGIEGRKCVNGSDHPFETGTCFQATACVTINVDYALCTKIAYDQNTGKKIITCPSGRVIRE